jgi:branched-chain amino acid transport system substrate-binding protein
MARADESGWIYMKLLVRTSALCLAGMLLLELAGCSRKSAPEAVYLGHLTPLSGPHAALGEHAKQGIVLALAEANQEDNLVAGHRLVVLHVDTGGELDRAQNEAVRLISINKVPALLHDFDAVQAEKLQLVQSYKVPLVSSTGVRRPADNKFLYGTGLAPHAQGEALARFVAEKLQKDKVAVLVANPNDAWVALAEAFALKLGKARVKRWTYQSESDLAEQTKKRGAGDGSALERKRETDFAELAGRVNEEAPQAVLVVGSAADFVRLRTALHKAGLKPAVPFLLAGGEENLHDLQASGQGKEAVHLATAFLLDDSTPRAQEIAKSLPRAQQFATEYRDRFGEPPDVHAALAYDSARLLFEAMRQAKTLEGEKIQEQLAELKDFETLTGPLSRRPALIVLLKDGRPGVVEAYPPGG